MHLKMAFHSQNARRIVEVFDNSGKFVAAIYPDDTTNGIKILSKYFDNLNPEIDLKDPIAPAMIINFIR